jgi:SNF2 family DNA or RNA helicase
MSVSYKFETKPFKHQLKAFEDSWAAPYYALFMEMGTGKSKVIIDNIAFLYEQKKINAALIVAPKGVYDNWIKLEIPTHMPKRIEKKVVRWGASKTKKFESEILNLVQEQSDELKIFVMNVEAFSTPRGARVAYAFLSKHPDNMVVIDESTTIKNRRALRTKNIVQMNKLSKYRRVLTGSPVTKSPMDLFSQCNFLSLNALNSKSYYAFQARYAVVQRRTMGHRSFQEITGYRRLDELNEKLDKFSNRVLKEDCLDLPDKVYMRREVELTPEQKKMYNQMSKLALTQLDNGELATTASVLTQIMRLQQICCGFIKPDDSDIQSLKSRRLEALLEVVEELQGKAIIWASYTYDIQQIASALRHRFGSESVATYYGATPQDDRQGIVEKFQDEESELRFFVGQPKTGGYGITLTAASTVIYYSNSYDLEVRLQSEDRAHRIGQNKSVTYIDLVSPGTIDEKILNALKNKINLAGEVLGEKARKWLI